MEDNTINELAQQIAAHDREILEKFCEAFWAAYSLSSDLEKKEKIDEITQAFKEQRICLEKTIVKEPFEFEYRIKIGEVLPPIIKEGLLTGRTCPRHQLLKSRYVQLVVKTHEM